MRIIILGAAAGGGLPQWNCGCRNCVSARSGRLAPMSQSAIAVSADAETWAVINASPDIRAQLLATPQFHPIGLRDSPLRAVLVTNGDLDHVAGLMTLREGQAFDLFATTAIHEALAMNPMLAALSPALVMRRTVALDTPFELVPGLTATLFAVPGKVPLYLEGERVQTDLVTDTTVGVELTANGRRVCYIPGCAELPNWLTARIEGANVLMFDGTLWTDDEMIEAGLGAKTSRRMGHLPVRESLSRLDDVNVGSRIYVHINNSNPLCDPGSDEARQVRAAGWQIGRDGMEIVP